MGTNEKDSEIADKAKRLDGDKSKCAFVHVNEFAYQQLINKGKFLLVV